ncbi:HipA N-terminal domain-containing protein [Williamwhitmania taraxaci]|uniref:Serine/threonine-protein kinase HipA n=1 Tax=Williamwhitmania taraxaci TaxID=1640674 RepID=A0A1G6IDI1_9BACT|nr:HipA N-terminal domain-containing protein [Williamwhitmania taraxaci]SDC04602.1 serine/threonine-protein kinase HipA [Williamwhitmania taraxaci]
MRKAEVRIGHTTAGWLTQNEDGYHFAYDADYMKSPNAEAISLTLPLKNTPFVSNVLFPFFDGLIPEGWLLDIAEKSWKLNSRDRMGLLMTCCHDCIGAVSVFPVNGEDEQ